MDELNQTAFESGDSAAYIVLSHEYGHAVQNYLRLMNSSTPIRTQELQADCLAGVFFAGSEYAGALEPGDVEEAISSAYASGDRDY